CLELIKKREVPVRVIAGRTLSQLLDLFTQRHAQSPGLPAQRARCEFVTESFRSPAPTADGNSLRGVPSTPLLPSTGRGSTRQNCLPSTAAAGNAARGLPSNFRLAPDSSFVTSGPELHSRRLTLFHLPPRRSEAV